MFGVYNSIHTTYPDNIWLHLFRKTKFEKKDDEKGTHSRIQTFECHKKKLFFSFEMNENPNARDCEIEHPFGFKRSYPRFFDLYLFSFVFRTSKFCILLALSQD